MCGRERKRARDRSRYRRRYGGDAVFRAAEKQRRVACRRAARARDRAVRAAGASGPGPPAEGPALVPQVRQLRWALTGIAAQLTGEEDSGAVAGLLNGWAERGRELEARAGP